MSSVSLVFRERNVPSRSRKERSDLVWMILTEIEL